MATCSPAWLHWMSPRPHWCETPDGGLVRGREAREAAAELILEAVEDGVAVDLGGNHRDVVEGYGLHGLEARRSSSAMALAASSGRSRR